MVRSGRDKMRGWRMEMSVGLQVQTGRRKQRQAVGDGHLAPAAVLLEEEERLFPPKLMRVVSGLSGQLEHLGGGQAQEPEPEPEPEARSVNSEEKET